MSMRLWSFRYIYLFMMLCICPAFAIAQVEPADTAIMKTGLKRSEKRYEERINRYRNSVPSYSKIQMYGDMGLISAGVGWNYGKRDQWETDIFLGLIPKYNSENAKATMTLKQNFMPWNIPLKGNFSFEPLSCGLYLNTVLDNNFWTHEPSRYPHGYYGFSTRIRIHIFLGERITYEIHQEKRFFAKAITLYYEISSCDLYIISAFTNRYLKPKDYLKLSFGLKFQIL